MNVEDIDSVALLSRGVTISLYNENEKLKNSVPIYESKQTKGTSVGRLYALSNIGSKFIIIKNMLGADVEF
jgi:hypothetical protein